PRAVRALARLPGAGWRARRSIPPRPSLRRAFLSPHRPAARALREPGAGGGERRTAAFLSPDESDEAAAHRVPGLLDLEVRLLEFGDLAPGADPLRQAAQVGLALREAGLAHVRESVVGVVAVARPRRRGVLFEHELECSGGGPVAIQLSSPALRFP